MSLHVFYFCMWGCGGKLILYLLYFWGVAVTSGVNIFLGVGK